MQGRQSMWNFLHGMLQGIAISQCKTVAAVKLKREQGICGAFCYPCLGCQVANAMDEFCLCGGSVAMRTLYRTRYNIPGSILGDYYSVMCCPMCALCQLKRDIDYRREQRTF
ncbi:PLAC8 like 1 isoform X1 [Gallus gallus]|uniref:PLAC8 like 1 isoform X1 n=1 Tax=Gallus gallus TaxID=9031 RepID=UPI001EFFA40A|nr:PLAC8 like 1 isoform X1 [Gallus gallus]